MMITIMYINILTFLILNTFSFYLLDYITDRMNSEKAKELTPNELSLYSTTRFATNIVTCGMVVSIIYNLFASLVKVF